MAFNKQLPLNFVVGKSVGIPLVWQVAFDIYGRIWEDSFNNKHFLPFRQLGQYEDEELGGRYYNRFRYYDPGSGNYISQDPIGLAGNNPNFYAYVYDSNTQIDPFGLLNEFGIAGYGSPLHVKDGLNAHELLQNAWLRNNGIVKGKMSGIATSNPAMALQENMMHKTISKLQSKYGLHNPNILKNQSALQNINRNTAITKKHL